MSDSAFTNDLSSMDLTENTVSTGAPVLKQGHYHVRCTDATIDNVKSGKGKKLTLQFDEVNGQGQIRETLNIVNASPDAQRIARDKLKTYLTLISHPDPNAPFKFPLKEMCGKDVFIFVKADGTYVKDNQTFDSYRVARFAEFDPAIRPMGEDPNHTPASKGGSTKSSSSSASGLDDEIPF